MAMLGAVIVFSGLLAADPGRSDIPSAEDMAFYQGAQAKAGRDPDAQVRLGLWCEAHGMPVERARHLALAVLADPAHAVARALMGLVADDGIWRRPEEVARRAREDAGLAARLADYNARRARAAKTADAQWRLAQWCEEQGLSAEATAHYTAVTRLDPGRDAAWKKLGYKKHDGRWMTQEQIDGVKADREAQAKADKHWAPLLEKWKSWLRDKSRRADAEAALAGVTDPRAVPAIGKVFGLGGANDQIRAAQMLGQIDSPGSSRALATLAVFAASPEVRRTAAETLRRRDPRDFAGFLVGLLRKPIKYEIKPVGGPGSPGALFVEGEKFNQRRIYAPPAPPSLARFFSDSVPFGPYAQSQYDDPWTAFSALAYQRAQAAALMGLRSPIGTIDVTTLAVQQDLLIARNAIEAQVAATSAQQQLAGDVATIETFNNQARATNEQATSILRDVTGADKGDDPQAWQVWWADQLGFTAETPSQSPKPTVTTNVPLAYLPSYAPRLHGYCFAAGTPVRTLAGEQPIETIQVGDRVLTQDVETGALGFQPVVALHHNPPHETLRIRLGDEAIVVTPLHSFWRAGRGWTKARDLKPGDAIRTLGGIARVADVESAGVQPVFNLDVARNRDYFVGHQAALAHDNGFVRTPPNPFDAPVLANAGRTAHTD
jgi:hypothetical protein